MFHDSLTMSYDGLNPTSCDHYECVSCHVTCQWGEIRSQMAVKSRDHEIRTGECNLEIAGTTEYRFIHRGFKFSCCFRLSGSYRYVNEL